jgi:hypothetical protein
LFLLVLGECYLKYRYNYQPSDSTALGFRF